MCSIATNTTGPCLCTDLVNAHSQCNHCHRSLVAYIDDQEIVAAAAAAAATASTEIERLKKELQQKDKVMKCLQEDLETINQKYISAINRVAEVQHEKDIVEHELEELSCKLFEQANGMVATEKREKWLLSQQLREAEEHLKAEQSQLQELRERIMKDEQRQDSQVVIRARMDLRQLHAKRASANNLYNSRCRSVAEQQQQQLRATSLPPPPPSAPATLPVISIDELQLETFREFVRSSHTKRFSQSAYMNHCLAEDIVPCLRFGPHSRLSVKKLNTLLSRQPCFIEQNHQDIATPISTFSSATTARPLWERFSSTYQGSQKQQQQQQQQQHLPVCMACRRSANHSPLTYRFRVDEMDEWAPIDQYCRDRLVAVCEFYVFIRNIQMGLYVDRAIDDLYTENIRLRLQMFYSRMGALPSMLDSIGIEPDAFGMAYQALDDAYISDASNSTGPTTPVLPQHQETTS